MAGCWRSVVPFVQPMLRTRPHPTGGRRYVSRRRDRRAPCSALSGARRTVRARALHGARSPAGGLRNARARRPRPAAGVLARILCCKSLDEWLSGVYIVGRYNYAFVEQVAGIAHDRSNLDFELGLFFTPQWSVRALFSAVETHGGIPVPVPPHPSAFRLSRPVGSGTAGNVGAGVSWSMSDRTDVYLLYLHSVWGESAHKLDQGVTFGFSYSLSAY